MPTNSPRAMRVLLVDDEPLILLILAGFLEGGPWETVAAKSADEALEKFEPGTFDIVITDRTMPEMDGIQLCSTLKQRQPELRVILISGMPPAAPLPAPESGGPDAFLAKPFTQTSLLDCLAGVLRP